MTRSDFKDTNGFLRNMDKFNLYTFVTVTSGI